MDSALGISLGIAALFFFIFIFNANIGYQLSKDSGFAFANKFYQSTQKGHTFRNSTWLEKLGIIWIVTDIFHLATYALTPLLPWTSKLVGELSPLIGLNIYLGSISEENRHPTIDEGGFFFVILTPIVVFVQNFFFLFCSLLTYGLFPLIVGRNISESVRPSIWERLRDEPVIPRQIRLSNYILYGKLAGPALLLMSQLENLFPPIRGSDVTRFYARQLSDLRDEWQWSHQRSSQRHPYWVIGDMFSPLWCLYLRVIIIFPAFAILSETVRIVLLIVFSVLFLVAVIAIVFSKNVGSKYLSNRLTISGAVAKSAQLPYLTLCAAMWSCTWPQQTLDIDPSMKCFEGKHLIWSVAAFLEIFSLTYPVLLYSLISFASDEHFTFQFFYIVFYSLLKCVTVIVPVFFDAQKSLLGLQIILASIWTLDLFLQLKYRPCNVHSVNVWRFALSLGLWWCYVCSIICAVIASEDNPIPLYLLILSFFFVLVGKYVGEIWFSKNRLQPPLTLQENPSSLTRSLSTFDTKYTLENSLSNLSPSFVRCVALMTLAMVWVTVYIYIQFTEFEELEDALTYTSRFIVEFLIVCFIGCSIFVVWKLCKYKAQLDVNLGDADRELFLNPRQSSTDYNSNLEEKLNESSYMEYGEIKARQKNMLELSQATRDKINNIPNKETICQYALSIKDQRDSVDGIGIELKETKKAEKNDGKEMIQLLEIAAEDPIAQYYLGVCYKNGIFDIEKDLKKAVYFYQLAAQQQHLTEAQNEFGICLRDGLGIQRDIKRAIHFFRLAVEKKCADAQYNLGACYRNGIGVKEDATEAVFLYRLAAAQGHAIAQHSLGICYQDGTGDYA